MQSKTIRLVVTIIIFYLFYGNAAAEMKNVHPDKACGYLTSIGLSTHPWEPYYGGVYSCLSTYQEFGSGHPLKNNLTYYVKGTAAAAKELKLVINVNNRTEAKQAHDKLLKGTETLVKKHINQDLPVAIKKAIVSGKNMSAKIGDTRIEVVSIAWPTRKGYEVKVIIK